MNNKKKEDRKKEEIKRQFQKAVSLSNEADGRLTRDQWTKVLMDAGIKRTMWVELTDIKLKRRMSYATSLLLLIQPFSWWKGYVVTLLYFLLG